MSKSNKIVLSKSQFQELMNHTFLGKSQNIVAENIGVSVDTVSRILKEYPEYKNKGNFTKTNGGFRLTDKESFLFAHHQYPDTSNGIEITGDIADGILVAQGSHVSSLKENSKEQNKSTNKIIVGKVLDIDEIYKMCSKEEAKEIEAKYFESLKYQVEIQTTGENPPSPTFKYKLNKINEVNDTDLKDHIEDDKLTWKRPKKEKAKEAPADDTSEYIWSANSKSVTISKGLNSNTVDSSNENFQDIMKFVLDGNFEKAISLMNIKSGLKTYSNGKLKIEGNKCYYENIEVSGEVITRMVSSMRNGEPFEKYVNFYLKLKNNPDSSVIERLYEFLKANDIEILENGNFSAYKVVTANYTDCRTGTIDNSVGTTVTMDRKYVDKNHKNTCSHGLHVCSKRYISEFRSSTNVVVITEVSPYDVVSVPFDYNGSKMRVCKYTVVKSTSM